MDRRAVRNAVIEFLEIRLNQAAVFPTAQEQLMVELINRARLDPVGEAQRFSTYSDARGMQFSGDLNEGLAAGTISSAPKQPLAINLNLTDSARTHSEYMGTAKVKSHTGSGGSSWQQRIAAAGYSGATATNENIDIYYSRSALVPQTTILAQHANLFTDMTLAGRAHRITLLNATYKEIGVGITNHTWQRVETEFASENTNDFAVRNSTPYLTGVAFSDKVTKDNFYTIGEGISGVTVTAKRKSDGKTFTTATWSSGGYSLALEPGTYDIKGTGGTLGSTIFYNSVVVGTANIKRDFVTGHPGDIDPANAFASVVSRTLVVNGTASDDVIAVSLVGSNYVATRNGVSQSFAASLVDAIAVKAGAGNDRVSNLTSLPSYLEGSDGKDRLIGGTGNDSIYGDGSPDYLDGGLGDDQIVGSGGGDFIQGGAGNDKIYGGSGDDIINGGANNDRIYAGIGNDTVAGDNGNDILYGEAGVDHLNGGGNTDASDNDSSDVRIAIEILM